MHRHDLTLELPESLIARYPAMPRDYSRLLQVPRQGPLSHHRFYDFPRLLQPGDAVIMNNSRVIPNRQAMIRARSGGALTVTLVGERPEGLLAMVPGGRKLKHGEQLLAPDGSPRAEVARESDAQGLLILSPLGGWDWLNPPGEAEVPLPPYIVRQRREDPRDSDWYQTVVAEVGGSAAAPTAGLHMTERVLKALTERGISVGFITLHTSLGTFLPIRTEQVQDHAMLSERLILPDSTAHLVTETQARGGNVVAVGTTVVRTLESWALNLVAPGAWTTTNLFITPGFEYRRCDCIVTNFHTSQSTPLALVMAFAGQSLIREAYHQAMRQRYRFYSYGDAMLLC